MPDATVVVPVDEIRDWLIERVAFYLQRTAEAVQPAVPLVELGLDSVYALTLCGDVEDRLGLIVMPTLAWDYPTVDAIAAHLHEQLRQSR